MELRRFAMARPIAFAVVGEVVLFRVWSGLLGSLGAVAGARKPQPALAKAVEMWPLQRMGPRIAPDMFAARCAYGSTAPTNTSAQSKGALWERAKRVPTARPNSPTVGAHTRRSQICAGRPEVAAAAEELGVKGLSPTQDGVSMMEE